MNFKYYVPVHFPWDMFLQEINYESRRSKAILFNPQIDYLYK